MKKLRIQFKSAESNIYNSYCNDFVFIVQLQTYLTLNLMMSKEMGRSQRGFQLTSTRSNAMNCCTLLINFSFIVDNIFCLNQNNLFCIIILHV